MVTCRRCGKQGWRYEMTVAYGMWYCQPCYISVEKALAPPAGQAEQELQQFLQRRRAHLEFVRYLVQRGVLDEELAGEKVHPALPEERERTVGR